MTLSKFISMWYLIGKMLCNVNAVSKGKTGKRILRMNAGRVTSKTLFSKGFWR